MKFNTKIEFNLRFVAIILFLAILGNSHQAVAQNRNCIPQLSVFVPPYSNNSSLTTPADTIRPGVATGCLEVGVQLTGSEVDNELVQSALIRIEEVNCTGDEQPVLLFEKLVERALPFGALSFPFDSELIGRPGEETVCYFIKNTVEGNTDGRCYKLTTDYVMNCGNTGTIFSYFFMESDFCFFQDQEPDFRTERTTICAGECIRFESFNLQIPDDFEWHFVGGSPATSSSYRPALVCYDQPGTYDVEMITGSCLRADTIYKTDFIEVLPAMELTFPSAQQLTTKEDDQLVLNACSQGENFTYNWFPRDYLSCWDCPNPIFTATESVDYQVTVRNPAGCELECQVQIDVLRKPQANFTLSDSLLCVDGCLQVSNRSAFSPTSYEWQFSNGEIERSADASPPQICYPTAGSFSIVLIVTNAVGSDTLRREIKVLPNVEMMNEVTQNLTVVADRSFQLTACATGSTYEWQPTDGLSCTDCPNPILNINQAIDYELIINQNSTCETRCFYEIDLVFEPARLYLPTAFSPNNDGVNDLYQWFGRNIELRQFSIFNRWGELVFQTTDPDQFWDGRFKNTLAATGVYFYTLSYRDLQTNYQENQSGSISLIR